MNRATTYCPGLGTVRSTSSTLAGVTESSGGRLLHSTAGRNDSPPTMEASRLSNDNSSRSRSSTVGASRIFCLSVRSRIIAAATR